MSTPGSTRNEGGLGHTGPPQPSTARGSPRVPFEVQTMEIDCLHCPLTDTTWSMTLETDRVSLVLTTMRPASPLPFPSTRTIQIREYHSSDFAPGLCGAPADTGQLIATSTLARPTHPVFVFVFVSVFVFVFSLEAACSTTSKITGI